MLFAGLNFAQECEDPYIQIETDCGTNFNLCADSYTTTEGTGILLEIYFNDDVGIFDPCDTDTVFGTANGTLTQLEDCNWFYLPDDGFIGEDNFDYILNFTDTCSTDLTNCYCDLSNPECDNGRIWTMTVQYKGLDSSDDPSYDPTVLVKGWKNNGQTTTFSTHEHLSFNDYYFVDGTSLSQVWTNWMFEVYYTGDTTLTPDLECTVHVSCSEQIFGNTYCGAIRPIGGCITGTGSKTDCIGIYDQTTTYTADTTNVVIIIQQILPIEIHDFDVNKRLNSNEIVWKLEPDPSLFNLTLEKSMDGIEFRQLATFNDDEKFVGSFIDFDINSEQIYYRLKGTDLQGEIEYSNNLVVSRESNLSFEVYPNPSKETFTINVPNGFEHGEVFIYNMNGKLLQRERLSGEVHEMNSNEFVLPGINLIVLRSNNQETKFQKLIKY
jgi:hypothetical protein